MHGSKTNKKNDKFYIRYDAGSHQVVWREDEITKNEVMIIIKNNSETERILFKVQKRIIENGENPHVSNWTPDLK